MVQRSRCAKALGLVLLGACAGVQPKAEGGLDGHDESVRVYPYPEEKAKALVTEVLAARAIFLQASADPHVLLSQVKHIETRGSKIEAKPDGVNMSLFVNPNALFYSQDRQWMVVFKALGPSATSVRIAVGNQTAWADQAERSEQIPGLASQPVRIDPRVPPTFTRAREEEAVVAAELDSRVAVEVGEAARDEEPTSAELAARVQPAADLAPPEGLQANALGECTLDSVDLQSVLAPGHLLLMADPLGAVEPLAAVDQVLCVASRRGLAVTLALSLPGTEQAAINRYLDSAGTGADRATLLAQRFWNRTWQDGRSSQAVLDQLERVRARRQAGQPVSVLAVDANIPGNRRMSYVASQLLSHRAAHPERAVVAVLGNAFVTRLHGQAWDQSLEPVGWRLAAVLPEQTHAFDVSFQAGTQWACQLANEGHLACGTWSLSPGPAQVSQAVTPRVYFRTFDHTSAYGFDGVYYVGGALTASPPAVVERRKDEGIVLQRRPSPRHAGAPPATGTLW